MVDEVVACERVDEVALAAQVRAGDRHELAVAGGRGERLRRAPGAPSPSGAKSAAATRIGGSSLVRDASTIAAIAASSPTASRRSSSSGVPCMRRPSEQAADTALTPPRLAQVLEISVLGPVEVRRDGRRAPGAGRQDRRAAGAPRARRRGACARRPARSTSCGPPTRHPPQHAAGEGRAAAPRARRPGRDRERRRRLPARGRPGAVDALRVLARRRRRRAAARRRRRPRRRRAERGGAGALPRRAAARGRRLGPAAPRRGWRRRARSCSRRSSPRRCGSARRRDRRARGGRRRRPVPGGPVGAADHRALPRGPPGRRARRLPAGPHAAERRSRARARPAPAASSSGRCSSTTPRCAPRAGNLPSLAAELVGREAEVAAVAGLLEAGTARRGRRARRHRQDRARDRRPGARCPAPSGWSGSSPRRRPTRCSTP